MNASFCFTWLHLLIVCLSLILPASTWADIKCRVSVKLILDSDGSLPNDGSTDLTYAAIAGYISTANAWLENDGRGYQLLLKEVVPVSGLSDWFDVDVTPGNRTSLESEIEQSAASMERYAYNETAINVYYNNRKSGEYSGYCAFPPQEDVILLRGDASARTLLHECGHYFNLLHTHQGSSGCEDDPCSTCTDTRVPGDEDEIDDTIPDHKCWDQDQLALAEFSDFYGNLSASRQRKVDDVFLNLMSYHSPPDPILTSDQWDRWTDAANGDRRGVITGRTLFVDDDALGIFPDGSSDATLTFGGPYKKLENGIDAASGGDIVLIRPGSYDEKLTITNGVTLRATRGNAIIGR
jgi:hypothetical protein